MTKEHEREWLLLWRYTPVVFRYSTDKAVHYYWDGFTVIDDNPHSPYRERRLERTPADHGFVFLGSGDMEMRRLVKEGFYGLPQLEISGRKWWEVRDSWANMGPHPPAQCMLIQVPFPLKEVQRQEKLKEGVRGFIGSDTRVTTVADRLGMSLWTLKVLLKAQMSEVYVLKGRLKTRSDWPTPDPRKLYGPVKD